jgi:hypothetical protein
VGHLYWLPGSLGAGEGELTTAVDLIEAEERRRDELVAKVRDVVAQHFAAGGDTGFCVPRGEVHRLVAEALERPVLGGQLIATVNAIVVGMGGVATTIGGRAVFLAVRPLSMDAKTARQYAQRLRRRWWGPKKASYSKRARKIGEAERQKWEALLRAEGLGEVLPLPRRAGGGLASREGRGMAVIDGVHRQRPTTQAEIYAGAEERATSMLAELEKEVAVLRLRAQGLALRPIAIKTGLQKDMVAAILKRIEARHSAPECE